LGDTERLVIVVSAHVTLSHGTLLSKHWSYLAQRQVTGWVPWSLSHRNQRLVVCFGSKPRVGEARRECPVHPPPAVVMTGIAGR
jgi:hypothetical protein